MKYLITLLLISFSISSYACSCFGEQSFCNHIKSNYFSNNDGIICLAESTGNYSNYDYGFRAYEMKIIDLIRGTIMPGNGTESTHIYIKGINGQNANDNPFAPNATNPFDNTENFPKEIQTIIADLENKYFALDLTQLSANVNDFSYEFQDWIFKYDIIVLIKNSMPTTAF